MKTLIHRFIQFFCILLTITLSSCVFRTEPTNYYILKSEAHNNLEQKSKSQKLQGVIISVLPVELPQYLSRIEMVTREGNVNILVHDFYEWGEDLDKGIARVLSTSLSQKLNLVGAVVTPLHLGITPSYLLKIEILNFEGELEKSTSLQARWTLQEGSEIIRQEIFTASLPLLNVSSGQDFNREEYMKIFSDYANKNSKLLEDLAENIKEFLLPLLSK